LIGRAEAQDQLRWWTSERLALAAEDGRVVVAEDRGDVLGVAEWGESEGVPAIWKLYVHSERRGHGIGRALIAAVIEHLAGGADRIRVETFAANVRAVRFYVREGFRIFRTVEHTNPALTVVWLERRVAGTTRS
jgi:ribosomal protein S18 acetylase RimI-like enzyme